MGLPSLDLSTCVVCVTCLCCCVRAGDVQLPLWALVSFGSYSLASVGYNLLTFRECPEASVELEKVDLSHSASRSETSHTPLLSLLSASQLTVILCRCMDMWDGRIWRLHVSG